LGPQLDWFWGELEVAWSNSFGDFNQ